MKVSFAKGSECVLLIEVFIDCFIYYFLCGKIVLLTSLDILKFLSRIYFYLKFILSRNGERGYFVLFLVLRGKSLVFRY